MVALPPRAAQEAGGDRPVHPAAAVQLETLHGERARHLSRQSAAHVLHHVQHHPAELRRRRDGQRQRRRACQHDEGSAGGPGQHLCRDARRQSGVPAAGSVLHARRSPSSTTTSTCRSCRSSRASSCSRSTTRWRCARSCRAAWTGWICNWTYLGFADDTPEMRAMRLKQANLAGPAGFVSMEDGAVGGFVQRGIAAAEQRNLGRRNGRRRRRNVGNPRDRGLGARLLESLARAYGRSELMTDADIAVPKSPR